MSNIACKAVKQMLLDKETTMVELNNTLNQINGTAHTVSNLSQKLHSGTIRFNDVAKIADLLGYVIKIDKK